MASMSTLSGANCIQFLWKACGTFQDVAKVLKTSEDNVDLKCFYVNLMAHCAIIREHASRVGKTTLRVGDELFTRVLHQLESTVTPKVLEKYPMLAPDQETGARLRAFEHLWSEASLQSDCGAKLELIKGFLDFGATPEIRNEFILSLAACEDDIMKRYPEDASQWAADDFVSKEKIREPSYAVWTAANSIFKALVGCRKCPCTSQHEFGARLCLGTYRKPSAGNDVDMVTEPDFDFDMFLSMKQDWYEARIHTTKEVTVQWAVPDEIQPVQVKKTRPTARAMRVKKLCDPMTKIRTMAAHRLELKVTRNQLYKLQSERSTSLIDKKKEPLSLQEFLRGGPRSFTEKTRRILAVILSSAVLHLHDTPWLPPTWNSSDVLFFRTASSSIPLRPFIQSHLSSLDSEILAEQLSSFKNESRRLNVAAVRSHSCADSDDIDPDDIDPDDVDPDDIDPDDVDPDDIDPDDMDPDDLMRHQCPILVMLAVMLMEVYFVTPFDELAQRYGVELTENTEESGLMRYLDANLVFQACRSEMPENTQFYYAVEKCLDAQIWEDEDGMELDSQTLRTKIYEEVVRPLEIELTQAYSSIPIDDLDRYAEGLDFAGWDQSIQDWNNRQIQAAASQESLQATNMSLRHSPSPRSASPYHHLLPTHLRHPQVFDLPVSPPYTDYFPHPVASPLTATDIDYRASRFFDDETVSEAHINDARLSYVAWRSKYDEVYKRFIPKRLEGTKPVKIAILDTGIDMTHPDVEARDENIKGKYNWLNAKRRDKVHDRNGHGTFTACLLMDYAPDAELYIAKIAEKEPSSPRLIAEAINYAVSTWKVDIISMSFGYPTSDRDGYADLEAALENANNNRVLLFAAASNSGGKLPCAFPAREPTVIAVHSTDTNGNRSAFSPTASAYELNLATVGEAIESAWPVVLCDEATDSRYLKYKSGTSYATPIVAGIAAFLLLYARVHMPDEADTLKKQKGMKALLKRVAEKGHTYQPRGGYHFVDLSLYADCLFGKGKDLIDLTIGDILRSV